MQIVTEHSCANGASPHTGGLFVTDCPGCQSQEALDSLTSAVRSIAHGGVDGPTGIEALVMALAGPGDPGGNNLTAAVGGAGSEIADGLRDVARGLYAVAEAIKASRP